MIVTMIIDGTEYTNSISGLEELVANKLMAARKEHYEKTLKDIFKYIWMQDKHGILDAHSKPGGVVTLMYNPEKIIEILKAV